MAKYSFALSDDLCREYLLFKQHSEDYDKDTVTKLLQYHMQEVFIMNLDQVDRIGADISQTLRINLRKSRLGGKSIDELSKETEYKLVLTSDRSTFPYVNIFDDNINSHITGCFYKNIPRSKALDHIKALCSSANKIHLYDAYLASDLTYKILNNIIPNSTNLEIVYMHDQLCTACISDLQGTLTNCQFTKTTNNPDDHHHDRYIIIDDKIEIILTSGFKYLTETNKELSYIVRQVSKNRFQP